MRPSSVSACTVWKVLELTMAQSRSAYSANRCVDLIWRPRAGTERGMHSQEFEHPVRRTVALPLCVFHFWKYDVYFVHPGVFDGREASCGECAMDRWWVHDRLDWKARELTRERRDVGMLLLVQEAR